MENPGNMEKIAKFRHHGKVGTMLLHNEEKELGHICQFPSNCILNGMYDLVITSPMVNCMLYTKFVKDFRMKSGILLILDYTSGCSIFSASKFQY